MPASRVQILECGANRVQLGRVRRYRKRHHIEWVAGATLPPGGGAGAGNDWAERACAAIRSLAPQSRLQGEVDLVLPAHLLLVKRFKLPRASRRRLGEVVRFEIERTVPLAPRDMTWDFMVTGARKDGCEAVAFVARRREVDALRSAASEIGLKPRRVLPAPVGLLGLVERLVPPAAGPALAIGIDERTAIVMLTAGGNSWIRIVGRRGLAGVRAIGTNDNPVGPRDSAGAAGEDERVRVLVRDVSRAIEEAFLETGSERPACCFVVGSDEREQEVGARIARGIGFAPEIVRAEAIAEISPVMNAEDACRRFEGMLGQALWLTGRRRTSVDLTPADTKRAGAVRRKLMWYTVAAVLGLVAPLPPMTHYLQTAEATRARALALERRIAESHEWEAANREAMARIEKLKSHLAGFDDFESQKRSWVSLLGELERVVGDGGVAWLDRLEPAANSNGDQLRGARRIQVTGRLVDTGAPESGSGARVRNRLGEIVAELRKSPEIASVEIERIGRDRLGVVRFELELVADTPSTIRAQ